MTNTIRKFECYCGRITDGKTGGIWCVPYFLLFWREWLYDRGLVLSLTFTRTQCMLCLGNETTVAASHPFPDIRVTQNSALPPREHGAPNLVSL